MQERSLFMSSQNYVVDPVIDRINMCAVLPHGFQQQIEKF